MNSKHLLNFLIPVILLLITIAAASIFGRQYFSKKSPDLNTPTPSSTLQPANTPTSTPTTTQYLNYKNFSARASFDYPSQMQMGKCADGVKFFIDIPESYDPTGSCGSEPLGIISATFLSVPFAGIDPSAEVFSVDEERVVIDGVQALRQSVDGKSYVFFERSGIYYRLTLSDSTYKSSFNSLITSFKFIEDPTKDWLTYTSSLGGFEIKYPNEYTINTRSAGFVDFTLDENTALVIESSGSVTSASLTAQKAATSIKNLTGWKEFPTVELKNIGGGTAQIIAGNFDNHYQQYLILWYQDRVIQMSWSDDLEKPNQQTLDNMLNSLVFVN